MPSTDADLPSSHQTHHWFAFCIRMHICILSTWCSITWSHCLTFCCARFSFLHSMLSKQWVLIAASCILPLPAWLLAALHHISSLFIYQWSTGGNGCWPCSYTKKSGWKQPKNSTVTVVNGGGCWSPKNNSTRNVGVVHWQQRVRVLTHTHPNNYTENEYWQPRNSIIPL